MFIIIIILVGCVIAANAFHLLALYAAAKFFLTRTASPQIECQPASVLIPLAAADLSVYQNYARLCRQQYPCPYQLVFCVRDQNDPAISLINTLKENFPDADIEIVKHPSINSANPKISNLQRMLERVKYEQLIIVDGRFRVREDFLSTIVEPLAERQVGMVTTLYRNSEAPDFNAKIEALEMPELAIAVLLARLAKGLDFALGTVIVTTKSILQLIGDFESISNHFSEAFSLGNLVARAGYEVRLVNYPVEKPLPLLTFTEMLRRQIRRRRVLRRLRPAGFFVWALNYGVPLAVLVCVVVGFSASSLMLLAATLLIRWLTVWMIGVQWMRDTVLQKPLWLLPWRDAVSLLAWCAALFSNRIEWDGQVFKLQSDGSFTETGRREEGKPGSG
ncbi:MAG: glycosyltransferase [Acidobacteriota bacterium]